MDVIQAATAAALQSINGAEPLQAHWLPAAVDDMTGNNNSGGINNALLPAHDEIAALDVIHVAQNVTLRRHFADKFDSRLVWYQDFVVGCFLVLVGLVSLMGNGASVIMFWRRFKLLTPAELLLLNLAVIHLFLAVCSYPAAMISSFCHRWIFGEVGCTIYGFTCYLVGVATMMSMLALAVVRYLKTCTHTYSRTLTVAHVKIVLVGVYLYSLFWSVLPLFASISRYEVEPFGTSCTLNWANPSRPSKIYIVAAVVFVIFLPYVVMIWCYCRIILLVRRNRLKKTIMGKKSSNSQAPSQLQLTIVSAMVCAGFLLAWLPYALVSIIYGLGGSHPPVLASLAPVLLAKSSCAYNPFIYVFVTERYRTEIVGIIHEQMGWLLQYFGYTPRNVQTQQSYSEDNLSSAVRIPVEEVTPDSCSKALLADNEETKNKKSPKKLSYEPSQTEVTSTNDGHIDRTTPEGHLPATEKADLERSQIQCQDNAQENIYMEEDSYQKQPGAEAAENSVAEVTQESDVRVHESSQSIHEQDSNVSYQAASLVVQNISVQNESCKLSSAEQNNTVFNKADIQEDYHPLYQIPDQPVTKTDSLNDKQIEQSTEIETDVGQSDARQRPHKMHSLQEYETENSQSFKSFKTSEKLHPTQTTDLAGSVVLTIQPMAEEEVKEQPNIITESVKDSHVEEKKLKNITDYEAPKQKKDQNEKENNTTEYEEVEGMRTEKEARTEDPAIISMEECAAADRLTYENSAFADSLENIQAEVKSDKNLHNNTAIASQSNNPSPSAELRVLGNTEDMVSS